MIQKDVNENWFKNYIVFLYYEMDNDGTKNISSEIKLTVIS